jgi:hypothetical protein
MSTNKNIFQPQLHDQASKTRHSNKGSNPLIYLRVQEIFSDLDVQYIMSFYIKFSGKYCV